ncbi:unnamed protein product [Ranitomeya imitator]|uniref:GPCR family 3 nine cysteines domain-containing protein n=1 Tax=Ranitomeya imitator TaxID=111125 RepID=A0ABN9LAJ5_9NEOB|nr:unnamed protein product [Ranitomeya imitator]
MAVINEWNRRPREVNATLLAFRAPIAQHVTAWSVPVSRCSDHCSPGSWKKVKPTIHTCCYDCIPCSEGEISNITVYQDEDGRE